MSERKSLKLRITQGSHSSEAHRMPLSATVKTVLDALRASWVKDAEGFRLHPTLELRDLDRNEAGEIVLSASEPVPAATPPEDKAPPAGVDEASAGLAALSLQGPDSGVVALRHEFTEKLIEVKAEVEAKMEAKMALLKFDRVGKAGSLTHTEIWNRDQNKEESVEAFFAGSDIHKAEDDPKLPEELAEWKTRDGPEVAVRQPLFMCAIARALGKAVGRTVGDVPRELTFPDGRTLVHTNGKAWLDGLIPDFGLFAPGCGPNAFGALLVIEMDHRDATDVISNSHSGKLLSYLHRLVSTAAFRELYNRRTYGLVTTGTQVRFASYDGRRTQVTCPLPMREAWPWLWALLNASPTALGRTLPTILAGDKKVPLQDCLGRGSFAAVFTAESGNKAGDKSDPPYFKVAIPSKATAIENEVRVLNALRADSARGPKTPTLSIAGEKKPLAVILEAPALPASPHKVVEEELRKLLIGVDSRSTSEVGCLPELMAYGHRVLQASPVFKSVTSFEQYTVQHGHIVDGLANLFRMSERGVAHGEIAPRHCGIFNRRLGFFDFGCGNVGGSAKLAFSGGHWFASDELLRLHADGTRDFVVKPADDVASFVKTVYVLLYPEAMVDLSRAAGDGSTDVRRTDWKGVLGFWQSEFALSSPVWTGALRAARSQDWPWLFRNFPRCGRAPRSPGKLTPPEEEEPLRCPATTSYGIVSLPAAPCSMPTTVRRLKKSAGKFHLPGCGYLPEVGVFVHKPLSEVKEQDLCKVCFKPKRTLC